ncbi:MAG: hypothetical protein V3V31_12165 [Methylococcales bacterium]
MKKLKIIPLVLVSYLISAGAGAEHYPVGSVILADCHGFFTKGKIKRLYKEDYVVDFDKDARPLLCTPYVWDNEFVVPYAPVSQYTGKIEVDPGGFGSDGRDVEFQVGDRLSIEFEVEKNALFSDKYAVIVAIREINSNGAASMDVVGGGDVEAKAAFNLWVGTNYIALDFTRKLKADKLEILKVEREEL